MKMMTKLNLLSLGTSLMITLLVLGLGAGILDRILYSSAQRISQLELASASQAIVQRLNRAGMRAAGQAAAELMAQMQREDGRQTAQLFVVDAQDGRVLFYPGYQTGDRIDGEFIDDMLRRHSGSAEYTSDGVTRVAEFDTIHPVEWLIGIAVSKNEILGQRNSFLYIIGVITLLALCLNALAVNLVGRHFERRIAASLDCLKRIEDGELSARIQAVESQDELGRLQDGINTMSERIERRTLDRRAAERALRLSEARLAFALDAGGLGPWNLDSATGTIICSAQCGRLLGYERPAKALTNWTLRSLLRHVLREDRRQIVEACRDAAAGPEHWRAECRIRRVDGAVRWIEIQGGASDIAADGGVAAFGGVVQDITERKQAWAHEQRALQLEGAVRALEEKFRLLREKSLDVILMLNTEGVVIEANPATENVLGRSRAETLGRSLFPAAVEPGQAKVLRDLLAGNTARSTRLRLAAADGTAVDLDVAATRVRADDQDVVLFIARDITRRLQLEQQLQQAQKMDAIGQLTGGIAHDFNNTLTAIIGTTEILIDLIADRPDLVAVAKVIDEAATRCADLTRQLLAFARKQMLQPRDIDVIKLVSDSIRLLNPILGEHIEIQTVMPADTWHAMADPAQLSSAVINLAVNARDAMPSGGKLIFETANVEVDANCAEGGELAPGRYVVLSVTDTGTGIDATVRDKVFEPFFTTKEVGQGSGLGLSMVYGFVKQSKGHIKLDSEVGRGTTFKLFLPRSESQRADVEIAPDARIKGGGETILIVEDDELVRKSVVSQVKSLGYAVRIAASGAEALDLVKRNVAFDLLFTDMIMPGGISGQELAREIAERRPGIKVLYTSGYSETAMLQEGQLDAGGALLQKPYRKADLARKLREMLRTRDLVE